LSLLQGTLSPGCAWSDWEAPGLGVKVKYAKCEANGMELRAVGHRVGMYKQGAPAGSPGKAVIEVYEKGDRQKIQEAIERKALAEVTARQKAGCAIVLNEELSSEARQVYVIQPNALYKAEAEAWRRSEPGAEVCGPYGVQDNLVYFEYHPQEIKRRFVFVRAGLMKGVVEPASLVLSKPVE